MKQGDIYFVNFDSSVGREYKKTRPALIVQSQSVCENSSLVTVMPITSQISKYEDLDVFISKDAKNRLMNDSVIMVRQISTLDKRRLLRKIGEVNSPVIRKVRGYLRKHFLL
jgi:mRNA interferase MazF